MINLYSIRDGLAEEFGPVYQAKNHGVASRNYRNLMKQNSIENGSEFKLFMVGQFDPETGGILVNDPIEINTSDRLADETNV